MSSLQLTSAYAGVVASRHSRSGQEKSPRMTHIACPTFHTSGSVSLRQLKARASTSAPRRLSLGSRYRVQPCMAANADTPCIPYCEEEPLGEDYEEFAQAAASGCNLIPVFSRIFSDQLTPVLAYRALVKQDDREAPSFLLESVVNGDQSGRYSFVGAQPAMEILAKGSTVTVLDHLKGTREVTEEDDPITVPEKLAMNWKPYRSAELPDAFTGGYVGYTGYDTVRYVYKNKLPMESAPPNEDDLLDMHLGLYRDTVLFDSSTKMAYVVVWVPLEPEQDVETEYRSGKARLQSLVNRLRSNKLPKLNPGHVSLSLTAKTQTAPSNMTKERFLDNIAKAKEYIVAGDIFQVVLSQRFYRRTFADPFDVYRSLRIVNPSPYMIYLQTRGCILVASSPEILCRVGSDRQVVNRPLAGTRKRGKTVEEDLALEAGLLEDEKEIAEHTMLVDLGRNDVGKVAQHGTVTVDKLMEVERYSHVMHISSTVTGTLKDGLTNWDALRSALPAGTVSGAPKVRAMQIIDELETLKRGPYGGGIGFISFLGTMDMALALRTMVVPTSSADNMYKYGSGHPHREWKINLQSGAGVVADSDPESEFQETVNKAAALGRAIDLAESAFDDG